LKVGVHLQTEVISSLRNYYFSEIPQSFSEIPQSGVSILRRAITSLDNAEDLSENFFGKFFALSLGPPSLRPLISGESPKSILRSNYFSEFITSVCR